MNKMRSGFTLIELLVSISIIAILSTIGLIAYTGITSRARDSQRIDDARKIVTVLELYKSSTSTYPIVADDWNTHSGKSQPWIPDIEVSNFRDNAVPVDPRNICCNPELRYYYRSNSNGSDYCLQISQESDASGTPYYNGKWNNSWKLRFGPQGANAALCGSLSTSP